LTSLDDLLTLIFDSPESPLYAEVFTRIRESRRFQTFAQAHHTKIRAKLRQATDAQKQQDLLAELHVAVLLLQQPAFSVEYEAYAARKLRGPDFTVTFKTHTPFNVEVRRIHSGSWTDDPEARIHKLMNVLCDKVRQMPPSIINVLWLCLEASMTVDEFTQAALRLRQLAEQKAEDYFTQRGFTNASAFTKQLHQMSAVVLQADRTLHLWLNPLARHPLPPKLMNTLDRLLRPSPDTS
jgi:hypothetical protein